MSDLTFAEVGEILALLRQFEGSDVELEWGDFSLRVRQSRGPEIADDKPAGAPVTSPAVAPAVTVSPSPPPTTTPVVAEDVPTHWVPVTAPMAGTFYRSPKPDEPAYVEVGDVVGAGDTVALVEVMKLFTELKTEVAGKVARVEAVDGVLAEFDQPLLWIEPA